MNNINNIFVSYGVIEEIIDTKISYIANLYHKSNFSLIFNLNNKLIGIGGYNYRQELNNIGIYFNEIITIFYINKINIIIFIYLILNIILKLGLN